MFATKFLPILTLVSSVLAVSNLSAPSSAAPDKNVTITWSSDSSDNGKVLTLALFSADGNQNGYPGGLALANTVNPQTNQVSVVWPQVQPGSYTLSFLDPSNGNSVVTSSSSFTVGGGSVLAQPPPAASTPASGSRSGTATAPASSRSASASAKSAISASEASVLSSIANGASATLSSIASGASAAASSVASGASAALSSAVSSISAGANPSQSGGAAQPLKANLNVQAVVAVVGGLLTGVLVL